MRVVASITLALLLGLLAARLPSVAEADPSFSWFGFVGGVAIVALATSVGRILAPTAAAADSGVISPAQRWLLWSALSCVLLALVSFVLLLYTPWQWPRYLAMVVVPVGALSVFVGVGTTWFGSKGGA